jgi:hypothetical protein
MRYLKTFENYNSDNYLYHETSKENYDSIMRNGFQVLEGERAYSDPFVPYGIFFKDNDKSIGLHKNPEHIKVKTDFKNPIIFKDRDDIKYQMREKDSCFKESIDKHDEIDDKYNLMSEEMMDSYIKSDISRADKAKKLETEHSALIKVWRDEIDEISVKCKECLTNYLLNNGYDSMVIENDKGSWGRKVKTYISLRDDNFKIVE